MDIPRFSVLKPVTTIMIITGIVVFGYISLNGLPKELFPPISYPKLTVVTPYENAAPEEVETLITRVIEEAVGTVGGVRRITSTSREGLSLVIVEFGWDQNMDFAALGVREKIDLVKERLPRGAEEPIVMKFNPFELPVITLSVSGDENLVKLRYLSEKKIKDELEKLDGVASASVSGGREREIQVNVDQGRLQASKVSILDVANAVRNANLNYPGGTIKESFYEYLVRTLGEFKHVDEIKEIPVSVDDLTKTEEQSYLEQDESKGKEERRLILLKDIATLSDGMKEDTSFSRFNGKDNISISIQKQAQENTLQIINRIKKALPQIKSELPPNINIEITYDQSTFIKDAISGVTNAAWQGGILTFAVLLPFLRSLWSAAIVTFTIPISILVAFTFMFFGKVSINMMSLSGLALGVGMFVDGAIVVVENIFRHQEEEGEGSKDASINGTNEVAIPVGASVLTTVVVFLPMVFVVGIAGQLFKELAFTVTFSLLASWGVALTLVPLLTSMGKGVYKKTTESQKEKTLIGRVEKVYYRAVAVFVRRKKTGLMIVIAIFIGSMLLFFLVDKELMPKTDQGQFVMRIKKPTGTVLEITNEASKKIEEDLSTCKDVDNFSAIVGSTKGRGSKDVLERLGTHQAQIIVNLKDKREITTDEFVRKLKDRVDKMRLGSTKVEYILQGSFIESTMQAAGRINLEVRGRDLTAIKNLALKLQENLAAIPGMYDIKNNIADPSPETKVNIVKDKASLYGLSVADIAQTAQIAVKGNVVSEYKEIGDEVDIRVRLRKEDRDDYSKLRNIMIHSPLGIDVPLAEVAYFVKGKGPSQIDRLDRERTVIVSANLFQRPLKDVVTDINSAIARMKVPQEYSIRMGGEAGEMKESFDSLKFALILSILLVYMIMASEFESLVQPFIIMLTVPLSLIGVAWAIFLTRTTLNVVVLMGVIMLGGIVVDNGIVMIDYINTLRSKGLPLEEAAVKGSRARMRPVLMTALTTILGLVPMAFLKGKGSELRSPLAISVMGGLTVATFLTLFVIPTVYIISENFFSIFRRKK